MYNLFFFQAEDGIRDIGVTGVQTCALPILKKINNPKEQVILNNQSELFIFLCEESDYLVVFKIPDSEFIEDMVNFGIKKPKFIQITEGEKTISELFSYEMDDIDELKNKKVNGIVYTPYILSLQDEGNAKKLKDRK